MRQSWQTRDRDKQKEAILRALKLLPDYAKAKLNLAYWYYRKTDYKNCQWYLGEIMKNKTSNRFFEAARQMGRCYYYGQKDYTKALEYYSLALEYSEYNEYGYKLFYEMAKCYRNLKDYDAAKDFYQMFLDNNWQPDKMKQEVEYAEKYQNQAK